MLNRFMHATVSVVLRFFFALLSSGKVESVQVGGKCERSLFVVSGLSPAGLSM